MKICFIVVDIVPYHVARFHACRNLGEIIVIDGGSEFCVGYSSPKVTGISLQSATPKTLNKVFRSVTPDVLIVPGWASPISRQATLWAIQKKCPVIVLSDSQLYGYRRNVLIDFIKKIVINFYSAAIVAGTRHTQYMQYFGMSANRIFTGVDVVDNLHFARGAAIARKYPTKLRAKLNLPERYILLVNRLIQEKNIPSLLQAYKYYLTSRKDGPLKLVIAGDGPLKPDLLKLVEKYDLNDHVHFKGSVAYDELPKYLGLAEIFILNSNSETWGLAVNEAMAAGLPVLVSEQCGSSPDLVRIGENGFIYDGNNPKLLASYLCNFSDNAYDLEAMAAASQAIISKWTPELFAKSVREAIVCSYSYPPQVSLFSRLLLSILCLIDRIKRQR